MVVSATVYSGPFMMARTSTYLLLLTLTLPLSMLAFPTTRTFRHFPSVCKERIYDQDPGTTLFTSINTTTALAAATQTNTISPVPTPTTTTSQLVNLVSSGAGEATLRLGEQATPTVWTEFSRLAMEYPSVNLGQGFPDWLPPPFVLESLVEAATDVLPSPINTLVRLDIPNWYSN